MAQLPTTPQLQAHLQTSQNVSHYNITHYQECIILYTSTNISLKWRQACIESLHGAYTVSCIWYPSSTILTNGVQITPAGWLRYLLLGMKFHHNGQFVWSNTLGISVGTLWVSASQVNVNCWPCWGLHQWGWINPLGASVFCMWHFECWNVAVDVCFLVSFANFRKC